MTDTAPAAPPNLVRFGRRSSRGLLLGFSAARVTCLGAAAAVFIPSLMVAGLLGAGATAGLWFSLLCAAFVSWGGRPLIETAPTAAHFLLRRAQGQGTYVVRPGKPRPAGTLALPGDAAALRWLSDAATGAVMVHDPHEQTLTAVARVSHPAYVLLSPDDQSRRVQGWGRPWPGWQPRAPAPGSRSWRPPNPTAAAGSSTGGTSNALSTPPRGPWRSTRSS